MKPSTSPTADATAARVFLNIKCRRGACRQTTHISWVADELQFDANAALNVASFVNTWMEPQADRLMQMTMGKNLIDQEEYPQTTNIAKRVLSMVAHLFHAPAASEAVGCITSGSSEALMLAFLAHHRAWTLRRRAQGLDTSRPNMIFGADAHTCLEKCAAYFDIEARIIPMTAKRRTLHADDVAAAIDERTVAVCAILGTTFTGQIDDIAGINTLLGGIEAERKWHIPLHIDAASGGFVLPFTQPDYVWDFRLDHVRSVNVSNHKFGLVYPGMGTLIFREKSDIPEELIFHINYLGGDMPNFSLNFSRPSGQVVAQYYNMLRLGHEGYCNVMQTIMSNARYLAARLREMDVFTLLGAAEHVPVVVARATDPQAVDVMKLAADLRQYGWVVPAYTLPKNAQEIKALRFVVRENLSRHMVDVLLDDISRTLGKPVLKPDRSRHPHAKADEGGDRPIC